MTMREILLRCVLATLGVAGLLRELNVLPALQESPVKAPTVSSVLDHRISAVEKLLVEAVQVLGAVASPLVLGNRLAGRRRRPRS